MWFISLHSTLVILGYIFSMGAFIICITNKDHPAH